MAISVSYKQGTKATYLGLVERNPYALYFCTDTKELFRGDDLYSDGLRIVDSYDKLPSFAFAADGVLYFCKDNSCGYVLSQDRAEWIPVVHGVDNETISLNGNGLLQVKTVPMESVTGLIEKLAEIEGKIVTSGNNIGIATADTPGLVMASSEISVLSDGKLSIVAIEQSKITGLEDRLTNIEKSIVGGIRYCGAVDTFEELPESASVGDLYEVYADNSEWCWNGEKWFEYGKTIEIPEGVTIDDVSTIAKMVDYVVSNKPVGTLVNYSDDEIRIMCPHDTKWEHQNPGTNGNPNMYYIGFRAYAPSGDVVSFKEDLAEIISDTTMYYFENNDFAGVDEYGRKYSIVWLPVAVYDENSKSWTYYGSNSSVKKYIGWHYSVEWYNANGVKVAADTIRINLSNEDCHTNATPFYIADIQSTIDSLEESYTWADM